MDIDPKDVTPDQEIDPSQVTPDEIDPEDVTPDEPKAHDSIAQQAMTGIEGFARGLTGHASDVGISKARDLAEAHSATPDFWAPKMEDVQARQQENPGIAGASEAAGLTAGLMTGKGLPGLMQKGATKLAPEIAGTLGQLGSAAIKGFIEMGGIQATDEISKAILGQGDPETPVSGAIARIGAAGLIGGATQGLFTGINQATGKGLSALENAKIGDKLNDLRTGIGIAAEAHAAGIPEEEIEQWAAKKYADQALTFDYRAYKPGVKAYYSGIQKALSAATKGAVDLGAGAIGYSLGGIRGGAEISAIAHKFIAPAIEKALGRPLIGLSKQAVTVIMDALAKGQTSGVFNALNYASSAAKGAKAINSGIEALFKAGGQQAVESAISDKDRDAVKEHIDDGGVNKEMEDSLIPVNQDTPAFAKGGVVSHSGQDQGTIAGLYPTQAAMMTTARTRMSNYLSALKPQKNPQKLAFDRQPSSTQADRTYNRAIDIAVSPLSILNHIKSGSLQADQVKHLNSMYPEFSQHLQKKITEGIMKHQLNEEQLPGRVKQAMALFLGAPLEQWMTPQGIMSIQATFLPKQPPQQAEKPKKGTGSLNKVSKDYKTVSQEAESDRSARD